MLLPLMLCCAVLSASRACVLPCSVSCCFWGVAWQSLRIGWLTATGGWKVFEMAWSLMSGSMSNCVQGGLDSGDLEYHVIVAKKP